MGILKVVAGVSPSHHGHGGILLGRIKNAGPNLPNHLSYIYIALSIDGGQI